MQQIDLFGLDVATDLPASYQRRRLPRATDAERAARLLAEHADFRVLRRLRSRPVSGRRPLAQDEALVVILDTETTGLSAQDEIIELAMVAVIHDRRGVVVDVVDTFDAFRQPSRAIPPEVTRLTGITWEMVEGRSIPAREVEDFVGDASLVICHNASFDRPVCERHYRVFADLPWACSLREVDWADLGYEGVKLPYLLGRHGLFYEAHRALDDCHALLELAAATVTVGAGTVLSALLARSAQPRFRIWAEHAPYDAKDKLKARRYRWSDGSSGGPRAWWVEVGEAALEDELTFLREQVYAWDASPRVQRLTAYERYKA